MQYDIPINKLEVAVKMPEYFKYKVHYNGTLQMPFTESQKNKRVRYSYRSNKYDNTTNFGGITQKNEETIDISYNHFDLSRENIPAFDAKEPYISSINKYISGVNFELNTVLFPNDSPRYYATTWEDVAKRIHKTASFGEELLKSSYYKDDLHTLINGKTNEVEIAFSIFNFVKSKIKWNENYGLYTVDGVRKAYNDGVGNVAEINLILTSMLQSAGLEANPVLVSTRSNGVPMFPTIDGYNYVVSSVLFKDESFALFDATSIYSLPNLLPTRTINWNGRLVKKDGISISINLVPSSLSETDNNISVKVSSDGIVEGILRSKLTQYDAYNYRLKYNHIKETDVQTKIEEEYDIEIENFRISNKTDIGKPISQLIKFKSEDLAEIIGGKLLIHPLLFLTSKINPFKLNERKFPVDFTSPWQVKNTVTIQIPDGYKVETIPEVKAISMSDDIGVFKFQVILDGSKINVVSVVQFNKAIITPEYYKELKEFYNQMVKKQTEKIVLIKE